VGAVNAEVDYEADFEVHRTSKGTHVRLPLKSPPPPDGWLATFRELAANRAVTVQEEPGRVWLVVRLDNDVDGPAAVAQIEEATSLVRAANDQFGTSGRLACEVDGAIQDWWTRKRRSAR